MQKINREALTKAIHEVDSNPYDPYDSLILAAAQLLLEITAPDYMMSKDMVRSAFNADCNIDAPSVIFRAMIQELVE